MDEEFKEENDHIQPFGQRPEWDKSRKYFHWTFTLHGHDFTQRDRIMANPAFTHIIMGTETGGHLEGPHFQGHCTFKSARYFNGVRTLLEKAWCEPSINPEAVIQYCKKEGDWVANGQEPRPLAAKAEGMIRVITDLYDLIPNIDETIEEYGMDIDTYHMQSHLDSLLHAIQPDHEYLDEADIFEEL